MCQVQKPHHPGEAFVFMAFEHLAIWYRYQARLAKLASDWLMWLFPKFRTFKRTQQAMRINHWLMSKYGYWKKRPDGATEFLEF